MNPSSMALACIEIIPLWSSQALSLARYKYFCISRFVDYACEMILMQDQYIANRQMVWATNSEELLLCTKEVY